MADYKLTNFGVTHVDGVDAPNEPGNADWERYQDWLKEGNTPDPADPAPVLVKVLTPDGLAALLETKGVLSSAEIEAAKV